MRVAARAWVVVLSTAAASGCTRTVDTDPPVEQSAATIALFAPDGAEPCNSVMPFPTNLSLDPETGKLKLPFCGPDADTPDTPEQTAMKRGLNTLDGFSINTAIYTAFSGNLDADTLAGAVTLVDTSTGDEVAVTAQFDETSRRLYIVPAAPLRERRTYIAVVTDDLADEKGNPVVRDQVFTFLASEEPLVDEYGYSNFPAALDHEQANALERLRAGYFGPLLETVADRFDRQEVLVIWSFTTQTVYSMVELVTSQMIGAGAVDVFFAQTIPAAAHPLVVAGIGAENAAALCLTTGHMELNDAIGERGTFVADGTGALQPRRTAADYMLLTPRAAEDATCADAAPGANLALFAHGLGRCKNDVLALAPAFTSVGWSILAVDGPRAGGRSLGSLGDQDLDGCPDQPATPELVAAGPGSVDPFGVRDRLLQWAAELVQVASAVRSDPGALVGAESGDTPPNLALVGHSWGGMAAVVAGAVSDSLDVLAVTATSGGLGRIFAPLVQRNVQQQLVGAGVDLATDAGRDLLASKTAEAVSTFTWVLEPADPLNTVAVYPDPVELPRLLQVVTAGGDMQDADLHGGDTQTLLAEALGMGGDTMWTMTCTGADGATEPMCDSPSAVVGSMLAPCTEPESPSWSAAYQRLVALQTQLVAFVATMGATVPPATDDPSCAP